MVHEQLMNSYLFLSLHGYATCHEYHYLSETRGYIRLCKYVSDHFDVIIQSGRPSDPGVIPESWKSSEKTNANQKIRREAMESALRHWIDWETDTVKLYTTLYNSLLDLAEVPASEFVKEYIMDAEEEIVYAKDELHKKTAIDFDIVSILEEQPAFTKEFKKKIRKIGE